MIPPLQPNYDIDRARWVREWTKPHIRRSALLGVPMWRADFHGHTGWGATPKAAADLARVKAQPPQPWFPQPLPNGPFYAVAPGRFVPGPAGAIVVEGDKVTPWSHTVCGTAVARAAAGY